MNKNKIGDFNESLFNIKIILKNKIILGFCEVRDVEISTNEWICEASEWVDVSELCDSEEEAHFWWATNFTDLIFSCEKVSFQPNNEIFKTINAD